MAVVIDIAFFWAGIVIEMPLELSMYLMTVYANPVGLGIKILSPLKD